jgi:hypothetical protein
VFNQRPRGGRWKHKRNTAQTGASAARHATRRLFMAQHPAHSQDHRHSGQPSPVAIQKALAGVDYPTTRERLAETARTHHADQEIIELIDRLPDRDYDSPAAVSKAIGQIE